MKVRKPRPSIAACIGRMIVHSAPKKPAASPVKKTVTASAHSSPVTMNPLHADRQPSYVPVRCPVEREIAAVRERSLMSPEVVRGELYGSARFLNAHLSGEDESFDAST
jgi:hypothetical protein